MEEDTLELLTSMVSKASDSEYDAFLKQIEYVMDTNPNCDVWVELLNEFPGAIPRRHHLTAELRIAMGRCFIGQIEELVSKGAVVTQTHLYYDLTAYIEDGEDLSGWCEGIIALREHYSGYKWLSRGRRPEPHPMLAEPDPDNLNHLLMTALFEASTEPHPDQPKKHYVADPMTNNSRILHGFIMSGRFGWRPSQIHHMWMVRWYENYAGFRWRALTNWMERVDWEWREYWLGGFFCLSETDA
ncbi:hypothetical protein HDV00_002795 [Rhizophlyctis rosea]|nr:hypothetical protein HDV00_002795 [Rhizophlyctis rosea]